MLKQLKPILSFLPLTERIQVSKALICLQNLNFYNVKTNSKSMATNSSPSPRKWESKKQLIVGLGNYDYKGTRHSVGMQVVDKLATQLHMKWQKDKDCAGYVASTELDDGTKLVLLKPKLPMNVNGTSVAKTASHYGINADNIYLIHDDIDRKIGKLHLKEGGGANGHNGVRSVMNSLRSDVMTRVLIGVDRPMCKSEVAEYVLEKFPYEEQRVINTVIQESLKKIAEHMCKHSSEELKKIIENDKENFSQGNIL